MGKTGLFAASAAALIVACVAGWAVANPQAYLVADYSFFTVSEAQAHVAAPATVQIDPFTMMTGAKQMPAEHFADYSFVFN